MRLAACCPMLACLRAAALLALALASVAAQNPSLPQGTASYAPIAPYAANVTSGILWVVVEYPQWNGTFLNTVTLPTGALLPSLPAQSGECRRARPAVALPAGLLLALKHPARFHLAPRGSSVTNGAGPKLSGAYVVRRRRHP